MMMKSLLAFALLLAAQPPQPAPQYFKHMREVTVSSGAAQNYVAADEALWRASEAALNDVRLYAGDAEVPYLRHESRGGDVTADTPATMLNLSKVGDRAQFILVVGNDRDDYNRVRIKLADSVKNFVSRVSVEGTDDDTFARWAKVGDYTLYDFSREDLGSNSTLNLPLLRYKYLFVKVYGMRPEQIQGATVARSVEQKMHWTELTPRDLKFEQRGRDTVISWTGDKNVPVDRVRVDVDGEKNFFRGVAISATNEEGRQAERSGFVRRITLNRGGRTIREADLEVDIDASNANSYVLTVRNGDDPPLDIRRVVPLIREARFYFDPANKRDLRLYVGDSALQPPQYDYARTATVSNDAAKTEMGPVIANPKFVVRPDARPWTERHPWVLWVALVIAVVVLGAIALRSLGANPKEA